MERYNERYDGFMQYERVGAKTQPVKERLTHFKEFEETISDPVASEQGARCMDCGVPFCQSETGCPVDNLIPEFNNLASRGLWREALYTLHATNNFPEFTGRLCPAPCETACVLGITDPPVTIKNLERAIIDYGFREGWVEPLAPRSLSGKNIAIVGSGPAGLACAQQLARAGHSPTVFERSKRLGGLLRYGIPDFKMEKWHIDRRIEQMKQEGVIFKEGVNVGMDITGAQLLNDFDALVLAMGSEKPIPLPLPGNHLKGIHYAMEYLVQANAVVAGDKVANQIHAKNKNVIVIGAGDTGSDCIGIANRQKAKNIINFRRSPQPPKERPPSQPWPLYPDTFYVSSSHEEGVNRYFSIRPVEAIGNSKGKVTHLKICHTEKKADGFADVPNSEETWDADLILLAMGYKGPVTEGIVMELVDRGLELDNYGSIVASFGIQNKSFCTSLPNVYSCGDARRGQSLVVWAISEGRKCAAQIHADLMT